MLRQANSLCHQLVERGRAYIATVKDGKVTVAHVNGQDEDNVGSIGHSKPLRTDRSICQSFGLSQGRMKLGLALYESMIIYAACQTAATLRWINSLGLYRYVEFSRTLTASAIAYMILNMFPTSTSPISLPGSVFAIFSVFVLLITACMTPDQYLLEDSAVQTGVTENTVSVIVEGDGNFASATIDNRVLTIEINSERGIGNASFSAADGSNPDRVILHLHLDGLERLEITTAEATVMAEVSSISPLTSIQFASTGTKGASLQPIASDSPFWLTIAPPSDRRDFFRVDLPSQLYRNTNQSIQLGWVDFYR